jgi:hypothetical protein
MKKIIFFVLHISLILAACAGNQTLAQSNDQNIDVVIVPTLITPPTKESKPMPNETTPPSETQDTASDKTNSESTQNLANANITYVRAVLEDNGKWIFHVTVEHLDAGWEDYANGWNVVTSEGIILKVNPNDPFTRLLAHPHVNEQPFTRSQSGIIIPDGVTQVIVQAHDIVDGFGGQDILVDLEKDSGPGFEVAR